MKLRIAAMVAVVLLVGAIAAYWWDIADKPTGGTQRPNAESSVPNATKDAPEARGSEPLPPPGSAVTPGLPQGRVRNANVSSAPPPKANLPPTPAPASARTPSFTPASPSSKPGDSSPPAPPQDPEGTAKAAIDVDKVGLMFRDYRTRMGENPTGTNAEIMRAVMGENPKQARLGPPEGQQLNGNGELVDRWGTPYFFHQMSRTDMEIRSAGPDRQMWTADDVVGR